MDYTKYEKHGQELELMFHNPMFGDKDRVGSVFVFDKEVKVWFLKSEYEKLNIEEDNFSRVPYLTTSNLDSQGFWKPIAEKV